MLPTFAVAPLLLLGAQGLPDYLYFDLTLSASASDPFVNSGPVSGSTLDLYLWLVCEESGLDGVWSVSCEFTPPPGVVTLGFDPLGGCLNAGDDTDVLLAIPGCPQGPQTLGVWYVMSTMSGSYCLGPHPEWGLATGTYCDCLSCFTPGRVRQIGYAAGGGTATCIQTEGFACGPTSVDPSSWGRVKALFR